MITKLSHATLFVLDQDKALDFYVNKLGFQKKMDMPMGPGMRWLTVGPEKQDLEIVLMPVVPGMIDAETVEQVKALLTKGVMGAGVFETDDCRATYAELKAKGVEFKSEPKVQPYGVEALFSDGVGNWFSLTEHPKVG